MPAARQHISAVIWPWVVIVAFMALFLLRARVVENHYGEVAGCVGCLFVPAIVQDLWILALAAGLLMVVVAAPWRLLSRLGGLGLTVLVIAYATDIYILHAFGIRLFLADVAVYGLSIPLIFEQFSSWAGGLIPAIGMIAVIVAAALLPVFLPRHGSSKLLVLLGTIGVFSAALAAFGPAPEFVNNWIYRNFLQANTVTSESNHYSESTVKAILETREETLPVHCESRPPDDRNVIVLVIESWSSYQSQAFGGHLDWTPELDALALENTRYTKLHAGGFSTSEGLVNIIGGVRLWAPFGHLFDAAGFGHAWGIEDSMPEVFNRAGFQTAFLTTGPLSFVRKGEWLLDLGFDYVEGNRHPFYDDWERVAFHAAADEALYRRALQWIDREADAPFLLVLETVSTHQPYINPETGEYDIAGSFRYADRWAAWFHRQLAAAGYFESGVLLVVSDHRSMTPVSVEEHQHFGRGAASRIPMILVDRNWRGPAVIDRVHGLGDLAPGLRGRVAGQVCTDPTQVDPFSTGEVDEGCAFHLRGDQRGMLDVFCQEGDGRVVLDGDNTRFIEASGLSLERQEQVLTAIALERIRGRERARKHASRESGE